MQNPFLTLNLFLLGTKARFLARFNANRRNCGQETHTQRWFSGKVQIRKVQRRDCRGGGDKSCFTSRDQSLSIGCAATATLEATAGGAATEKLPAQVCASGSGASEITQQLLLAGEMLTGGFSACSIAIPIRSQFASVWGVTHSLGCEYTSAQAETRS